jgi:hypothetical protein
MTVPPTTPGTLGRARAWITKTPLSNGRSMTRRVARGSLLAALPAIAAIALTGALAAGAQAAAHPDDRSIYKASEDDCGDKRAIFVETRGRWRCQNLYMARVTLDARKQPGDNRDGARINAIKAGEWISISCQAYAFEKGTGKRLGLYDMLPGGEFIPDKYVRTLYTGRIPGAPWCDPLPGGRRWRPAPR